MKSDLEISKRHEYGYDIVDLVGEITFEDSKKVELFVQTNINRSTGSVVLNMARVPFINSSALSLLVKILHDLSAMNIELFIMNPNETVRGLLEMTGVKKYFQFISNETSLMEKLKKKELNDTLDLND